MNLTTPTSAPAFTRVAVIGTGAMGRGIAQIAAQAGSTVCLFDAQPHAADKARSALIETWAKLVDKGKLPAETVQACGEHLIVCSSLQEIADCDLVIEAIVEKLEVKQSVFKELEAIVRADCVLASNTSSLSITAIASALHTPQRLAGYHFFNPVPLMKVVEVIAGLKTAPEVCERLVAFSKALGHTPVRASDTPGFIVNHAGRGYGTEALRIVGESISDFATIDAILKDQVGFRLGPFELMDLTALDVSHPVMESIYHQYYEEARYRPSVITAQRLAGGMVGKKVGQGFYAYDEKGHRKPALAHTESASPAIKTVAYQVPKEQWPPVWISPNAARRAQLIDLVNKLGARIETGRTPSLDALTLLAPLGWDCTTVAVMERYDPARTVAIDMLLDDAATKRRVLMSNPATRADMMDAAASIFASDGKAVSTIRDSAGFVSQRVIAAIVNIATDMCQQGVCTPTDLDLAVTLGLGYPKGPLALGDLVGGASVLEVLINMQTVYGDPRYRPSPWLRRRAALGLSLMHTES
jgi:3-hydroxybutyryl-CoA dehydrogenase